MSVEIITETTLAREAASQVEQARALQVTDQASYNHAGEVAIRLNALAKKYTEHHAPNIASAHAAHVAAIRTRDTLVNPLVSAREILTVKIRDYEREMKRLADMEARRLEEEAKRLAAEALEAQIEEMERGDASGVEVAAAIAEHKTMPLYVPPPPKPVAKIPGMSTRKSWIAEVSNAKEFYQNALTDRILYAVISDPDVLDVIGQKLSAMARTSKGRVEIPGVKVREIDYSTITRRS
jgi:hypothetical protein